MLMTARSPREAMAGCRQLVDPALRVAVDSLPGSMRTIAGYHLGWWDDTGIPTTGSSGKALRPALAVLAAEAAGGAATDAVPAAVAVELVHNFSLLHDDVMDRDLTRRHRRTAWAVYGVNPALLAGDALLALAFDVLARSGSPVAADAARTLCGAVMQLLDGQYVDLAFERRTDVDQTEAVQMARRKSGALLGCACALGAMYGGGSRARIEALRGFGEHVGLAFQVADDLLGIWGDPSVTGKPVYSDLSNRKKSLPVVAALRSGTPAGSELAQLYHREAPLTGPELARAADLVERAGGRTWCRATADESLATALRLLDDALDGVTAGHRCATELAAMARTAANRTC